MNFLRTVLSALRNYFSFRGRANRRDFWYWIGFVAIVYLALRYVELYYLTEWAGFLPYEEVPQFPEWITSRPELAESLAFLPGYMTWLSWGWIAFCIIPTLTLIVRRVHDHDKPGYMALTVLPLVWWLTGKGTKGPNRYG